MKTMIEYQQGPAAGRRIPRGAQQQGVLSESVSDKADDLATNAGNGRLFRDSLETYRGRLPGQGEDGVVGRSTIVALRRRRYRKSGNESNGDRQEYLELQGSFPCIRMIAVHKP